MECPLHGNTGGMSKSGESQWAQWRAALDAKRGTNAGASVAAKGSAATRTTQPFRSGAFPSKSGGKGFMPFKATGHKGGISRQH